MAMVTEKGTLSNFTCHINRVLDIIDICVHDEMCGVYMCLK